MICCLFLLFLVSLSKCFSSQSQNHQEFSGLYFPNLKYSLEVYCAAWIQKKEKFLENLPQIKEISSLESTSTGALMKYQQDRRFILMTRDYFDFEIEHLSSTINTIGEEKKLHSHFIYLARSKSLWLKKIATEIPNTPSHKPLMNLTVVIIPFSTRGGTFGKSHQLRVSFFEATFWSIYRYMPHIAVAVSTEHDERSIKQLQLPVFEIFRFNQTRISWELPKYSLLKAHESLSSNPRWSSFEYLYFTEGDQILHMRHQTDIMKFLVSTKGKFAIVPHRMQVSCYID